MSDAVIDELFLFFVGKGAPFFALMPRQDDLCHRGIEFIVTCGEVKDTAQDKLQFLCRAVFAFFHIAEQEALHELTIYVGKRSVRKSGAMSCSKSRLYSLKVSGFVVFSLRVSQFFAKSLKRTVCLLSILQNNDMKFPHFPWVCFEDELRACMEYGTVYNLAAVKEWVNLKRRRFERHGNSDWQLYGYDVCRYGYEYDDALKTSDLFDVLETYAQAYFIYIMQSSLIVANYSIRTDNTQISGGNFPLWLTDFFSELGRVHSRHAHILDFDVLRLGRKVMENNPRAGSFEFGVIGITEIGKERGNNLELKEVKKGTDEANQKNDLFNSWLKMCRHSATVDNFPFIKVFTDEQRPESWGADARDLCDVIHIVSSGDTRLTLPLYTIEEMISEWAFNRFVRLYEDFRFRRGDNTLLVHVLKSITAWLWRRNIRVYNRYGYSILKIEKERGTMDGKAENKKYFIMNAKIYSRRFATDCFSDYFNDMAKKSGTGLNDYREYVTEKATVEELKQQNSYFINALYREDDAA